MADERDVEAAIRSDTRQTPEYQEIVLSVYRTALDRSKEARATRRPGGTENMDSATADLHSALEELPSPRRTEASATRRT